MIKKVTRDKGGHFIMTKGTIHEEDITYIYISNLGAPRYIKKLLTDLKGEIDKNTIIVGVLNNQLTTMYKSASYKVNKEILALLK